MQNNPVTFLLVEDDDIDFWAMERSLDTLKISNQLIRTTDALEALELIAQKSGDKNFRDSLIILLDLNLPCMSGFEFLERLQSQTAYQDIPVIITTTSDANTDLVMAGERGVADYVLKSDLTEGLREALENLNIYSQVALKPTKMKPTISTHLPKKYIPEMATA